MRARSTAVAFQNPRLGIGAAVRGCVSVLWLVLGVIGAVVVMAPAHAAELQATFEFNLPAQRVADSLRAIGQMTATNILFDPQTVGVRQAPEVKGNLTATGAVEKVIAGMGLQVHQMRDLLVIKGVGERTSLLPGSEGELWFAQAESSGAADSTNTQGMGKIQDSPKESTASSGNKIQEIVVTAQKREERLQDVPISISVLRGDDLDSSTVEGITEALNRVPGVATTPPFQGGGHGIVMRGVTASGQIFSGSSPVAYYLDAVPFGLVKDAIIPDSNVYDLERVEVLRGPQGTLYGASAQNGVVRVLTKDASADNFELKARTSVSATEIGGGNYRGDMAVNVPIVEGKLAARAVVGYQDSSGWIDTPNDKDINYAEIRNMRLKINAQATEELAIGLSAWSSRADYGAPSYSSDDGIRVLQPAVDELNQSDYDVYGVKIDYDFPAFSLTSATGYLNYSTGGNQDYAQYNPGAGWYAFTGLESDVLSQEVILNSTHGDSWRWSLGGMYRDAEGRLVYVAPAFGSNLDWGDFSKSFAAFGELTRILLDGRLELTAGLRYFEDDVTQKEHISWTGDPAVPLYDRDTHFSKVSPRLVLTWHPSANLTTYASYSEGFRSGFHQNSITASVAPEFPPVKPDNLTNYELGAKGSLWEGRVNFDAALYYIDWQDVQQTVVLEFRGIGITALGNGESASGMGFDFGATAALVDRLTLGVNFSWNDLAMDGDVFLGPGDLLFAEGDRLNASPEYTVGTSVDYAFPFGGNSFQGRFSAGVNYTSELNARSVAFGVRRNSAGDPMLIARTSFSIDAPDHWAATLFVDNVNNEDGKLSNGDAFPDWSMRVRPRTIGVQLEYRF